jgi:hypothetical protein
MNLTNQEAQIVNTTISNLRKNLSEGDFDLWQEVLTSEILKDIARSLNSKAVDAGHKIWAISHVDNKFRN